MNRKLSLTLAIALAVAAGTSFAQNPAGNLSTTDVIRLVEGAGYSNVREIEFDDGLWDVEATAADGRSVDLKIDPANGEIIDPFAAPSLSAADIASRLQSQGFSNVRDIEFDDGYYDVEATGPDGRHVDLKVHARDGRILSQDHDD